MSDEINSIVAQERDEIISSLPRTGYPDGLPLTPPNAWVYLDPGGRLCILLVDGGWLGVDPKNFQHLDADLAPFHG